jgi:hypothetical protein
VSWDDDPHQELEMKKGVTVMVTPFGFVFPERVNCRPRLSSVVDETQG